MILSRVPKLLIALALLLLVIALPWLLPTRDLHLAVEILIAGTFAMSLGLIMGHGGMVSLGHAAFFSIGGYTAGLLLEAGVPFGAAFLIAPAAAAVGGWLMGLVAARRSHAYLLMLTFALGQLVFSVFFRWRSLTGGDDGLIGIRPPDWLLPLSNFYWFSLGLGAASVLILYRVYKSPFGYSLRAVRDSQSRALASGIPIRRQQIVAFIIGALFAGLAGAQSAFFNRAFFPGSAHWLHSADAFVAVILGGPQLFLGPLLGAVILEALSELISRYTVYWYLILGGTMIAIALLAPRGVGPLLVELSRKWRARLSSRWDKESQSPLLQSEKPAPSSKSEIA
jgi:branched-chain amino acid transport system permease protein